MNGQARSERALELPPLDDEMLSRLGHQLKTPLAVIVGYSELLRTRDDEETRTEATLRIHEASELLSFVVDDLMLVLALEAGRVFLDPVPVALGPAVDEVLARFSERHAAHALVTRSEDGAPWPSVLADAHYLPRILTNVVLSACALAPELAEVSLEAARKDGFAEVSVHGAEVSLAEEQVATAFDRFSVLEPPRNSKVRSTGFELYAARRLVELHGGAISIDRDGTMRLTLPLTDEGGAA